MSVDEWLVQTSVTVSFCVASVLHTMSLLGSSFVEEEHQMWYFLTVTIWLVTAIHLMMRRLQHMTSSNGSQTSYQSSLQQKHEGYISVMMFMYIDLLPICYPLYSRVTFKLLEAVPAPARNMKGTLTKFNSEVVPLSDEGITDVDTYRSCLLLSIVKHS